MAFAGLSGANAGKLQRHHFAVEQRNQPAHRTHEALRRLAAPVHALRPVDAGDFLGQRLGKDLRRRAPFLLHRGAQVFTLRGRDLLQGIDRDVELAGKGFRGRGRRAVLVGDFERRPGDLLGDVGLRRRYARSQHGQTARGGIGLQRGSSRPAARAVGDRQRGEPVRRGRCRSCAREFLRYRFRVGSP